jgi:hypothetical protein
MDETLTTWPGLGSPGSGCSPRSRLVEEQHRSAVEPGVRINQTGAGLQETAAIVDVGGVARQVTNAAGPVPAYGDRATGNRSAPRLHFVYRVHVGISHGTLNYRTCGVRVPEARPPG